jgi:mRNA-degrading endonuclease YafQ of YafQ-DinJ toxin-antitoxin module
MGEHVNIQQVLDKFDIVFGNVLPAEKLMEQFYTARQGHAQSVANWGCQLEDILNNITQQSEVNKRAKDDMLRSKFWSGLKDERVKINLRHLYDTSASHEQLLRKARIIEQEYSVVTPTSTVATSSVTATKVAHVSQIQTSPPNPQSRKTLNTQITELHDKLAELETKQQKRKQNITCFGCGQRGHYKRECTNKGSGSNSTSENLKE